jgi:hypothetical protein
VPASTARYWLREHRHAATKAGYPLAVLVEVFAANGRPIDPHSLLAAQQTRRLRGPSRQLLRREEVPPTPLGADAFAALVGQIATNAATGEAILDELRGIRAALKADLAQRQANAARLEALEAAVAAAQGETAALRAALTPSALPARRERPWWRRLLGRG